MDCILVDCQNILDIIVSLRFKIHFDFTIEIFFFLLIVVLRNQLHSVRQLFSQAELGTHVVQAKRHRILQQINIDANDNLCDQYKNTILSSFDDYKLGEKTLHLFKFIYLTDLSTNDVAHLKSLLLKWERAYNISMKEKYSRFAIDIMRTCHILNKPDTAYNVGILITHIAGNVANEIVFNSLTKVGKNVSFSVIQTWKPYLINKKHI